MSPIRGEVWKADLGITAKNRSVIIVSRVDPDPPRALIIYVPVTSKNRGSKYEVALPKLSFLTEESWANAQGVASLPRHKFLYKCGKLPPDVLAEVEQALLFAMGMETMPKRDQSQEALRQVEQITNSKPEGKD